MLLPLKTAAALHTALWGEPVMSTSVAATSNSESTVMSGLRTHGFSINGQTICQLAYS